MDKLLSYNFFKAHRAITKYMNVVFKKGREITITQIFALWAVKHYEGHNLSYIAKKLCMDRTTLFRTIDRMEDLVNIGRDRGRSLYPNLTRKGSALLDSLSDDVENRDDQLSAKITTDLRSVMKFLDIVEERIGYAALADKVKDFE